jgi:cellulose synthase/poly-beta-1,6-N-acetylglucosamine synthase-like glycosyltransferase
VDKENGRKADALNAGINASLCPYFLSIDADSVIDELALLQAFRTLLNNKGIVAIGGQVAILNGSVIKKGKVIQTKLPNCWLVRFQIVEYLRSFTLGRTALSRLNSLLIISGVFGIFQKEFVKKVGGYLTKGLTSKIASEYAGSMAETVCEDMEIIVRMQRYIQDKKLNKRIAYLPHPLCWTEAPENLDSLSKQRSRWQRGFLETMVYHRKMLFNKDYGRIGLFAFPYFLFFELLGGPLEFFGYVTLPFLFIFHSFNYSYLLMFILVSIIYGVLISVSSIVVGAWPSKTAGADTSIKPLIYFRNTREIILLLAFAVLENFGYRQLTLWWRIKGTVDFIQGKKRWEKFQRIGFCEESQNRGGQRVATN